jgi:hypothetical protein
LNRSIYEEASVSDEREQQTWLSNTLRQSPVGAADGCPDAETLAAWVDGGLSAKAAAAVELHASNCSQCIAMLAAMERSAPAARVRHAWTPGRLFRWLAPITAAATAVAIWIAVPDRPVTSNRAQDLEAAPAAPMVQVPVPTPIPVPDAAPVPGPAPGATLGASEPRITNAEPQARNFEAGTRNRDAGTQNKEFETRSAQPSAEAELRDDYRRESALQKSLGASAEASDAAAAPEAPRGPTGAPPPAAAAESVPSAAAQRAASAARADAPSVDTVNETVALARRSPQTKAADSIESIAPANSSYRWRIVGSRIERSINGGRTWTRTRVPPRPPTAIRSVDADRAVARTSDNAEFYTVDGGRSWTRVQENSAAPF